MPEDIEEGAAYPTNQTILEIMEELGIGAKVESYTAPVSEFTGEDVIGWTGTYSYQGKKLELYFYTHPESTADDPTADQILSTVLMEGQYLDYSFEEWCDNFGYDPDSRKEERRYNAVMENAQKVKDFLGEHFERFMEAD